MQAAGIYNSHNSRGFDRDRYDDTDRKLERMYIHENEGNSLKPINVYFPEALSSCEHQIRIQARYSEHSIWGCNKAVLILSILEPVILQLIMHVSSM